MAKLMDFPNYRGIVRIVHSGYVVFHVHFFSESSFQIKCEQETLKFEFPANYLMILSFSYRFYALASRAFHMKCNRIQLTNNIFSNLQDASLSVTYGMADIQGNTFEKLTGKPFVDLRPLSEIVSTFVILLIVLITGSSLTLTSGALYLSINFELDFQPNR